MAKNDGLSIGRLKRAINAARQSLEPYRETRREAVRQYAGNHYSRETSGKKRPVNLLAQYIQIVGQALVAKNPRFMLSTLDRAKKPMVSAMQSWMNAEVEKMYLADTLQRVVVDALFCVGITKIALVTPAMSSLYGWNREPGQVMCERVDLDDFVFDVHARDFRESAFMGHRYRVPLSVVQESKLYSAARKDLVATPDTHHNETGDERVHRLGLGYESGDFEEFEDMVDLWEIYLPRRGVVLTLADLEGDDERPLREQEWLGPACGPYEILSLGIVPGNAMSKGPIMDLIDLDEGVNETLRKLMRQAQRQKDITLVTNGADKDGNRVVQCSDGEVIGVDDARSMAQVSFGGPNPKNLQMFMVLWEKFNSMAGNLELIGGLGAQSPTARQDAMLNENSSKALSHMIAKVINHVGNVGKALGWFWYNDPFKVMKTSISPPGLPDVQMERKVYPRGYQGAPPQMTRDGYWEDLMIRVDPYSLQYQTPQARGQQLMQLFQQFQPIMPMLAQQGITVDLNFLLTKLAEYMDSPDLSELFTIQEPMAVDGGPSAPPAAGGMGEDSVTYRETAPTRTRQGNDLNMVNALMGVDGGGAPQPSMNGAA